MDSKKSVGKSRGKSVGPFKKIMKRRGFDMKRATSLLPSLLLPILLSGCAAGADSGKMSLSIVYGVAAAISLLLLVGYCLWVQRKDIWFLLLFASVLVVNTGYLSLSISRSLEEALLANRISYFGSVFLPMSMLMSILNVTRIRYRKWVPVLLLIVGILVFLIAASPGYLDIYYKEVSYEKMDGIAVLKKVYGPWHRIYLIYLLGYFAAMIAVIRHAVVKKRVASGTHAVILAIAVLVNIFVWLVEQFVDINFEFLSISYIISELFLLGIHFVIQENEILRQRAENDAFRVGDEGNPSVNADEDAPRSGTAERPEPEKPAALDDRCRQFLSGLRELTQTERLIYEAYLKGETTKAIMASLNIKENTLKFHNKNIYGKLGVSSRKQLMEVHRQIHAGKGNQMDAGDVGD